VGAGAESAVQGGLNPFWWLTICGESRSPIVMRNSGSFFEEIGEARVRQPQLGPLGSQA